MRRSKLLGFVLVLALCATVVGVALASNSKAPAKPHAKVLPHAKVVPAIRRSLPAKVTVRATGSGARTAAAAKQGNLGENPAGDPDNVQQGDQNGPEDDAQVAETSGESESTPGDASDGVEQPAGTDHQCPPDCASGEQS